MLEDDCIYCRLAISSGQNVNIWRIKFPHAWFIPDTVTFNKNVTKNAEL